MLFSFYFQKHVSTKTIIIIFIMKMIIITIYRLQTIDFPIYYYCKISIFINFDTYSLRKLEQFKLVVYSLILQTKNSMCILSKIDFKPTVIKYNTLFIFFILFLLFIYHFKKSMKYKFLVFFQAKIKSIIK